MVIRPPPYSPAGISPEKSRYSSGWSSVCMARWLRRLVAGQAAGDGEGDQHAVAFQADVPVQAAGVVLLDDEAPALARRRASARHRLRRAGGVPLAAIFIEPVGHVSIVCPARAGNTPM